MVTARWSSDPTSHTEYSQSISDIGGFAMESIPRNPFRRFVTRDNHFALVYTIRGQVVVWEEIY